MTLGTYKKFDFSFPFSVRTTAMALVAALAFSACTTTGGDRRSGDGSEDDSAMSDATTGRGRIKRPYDPEKTPAEIIDLNGLQRSLGLNPSASDYGFLEKGFATCDAGYGYSATHRCRTNYFVLINVQLLCRDSEGTVSTTLQYDEMDPLSNRTVYWELAGERGTLTLDALGRGQIRSIFSSSPREKRLRVSTGNDFLYMQAGAIKRVITPKKWCQR